MSEQLENDLTFVVSARRVAKVVEGGRNFKISVLVVSGDGKGRVGFGMGKAAEHANALEKAKNRAKKNMIKVHLLDQRTIYHNIKHKFKACRIELIRARQGHGIIAGNAMRAVFSALGVKDIIAKAHYSHNPINVVACTVQALQKIQSDHYISKKRSA